MKIVCYYEALWDSIRKNDDLDLIDLWKKSWERQGFEPVILGIENANKHELSEEFERCVSLHPTVNDKHYEMACWRRHLAYDLSGASLFSDYDLINYGWKLPEWVLNERLHSFFGAGLFFVNRDHGYGWLLETFMQNPIPVLIDGKLHSSDMTAIRGIPFRQNENDCYDYGQPGWENSPLVHYGNSIFGTEKRAERIRQVRTLK